MPIIPSLEYKFLGRVCEREMSIPWLYGMEWIVRA
jgi:hypothetical protein